MELTFNTLSHLSGLISFFVLAVYILLRNTQRPVERALLSAALLSCVWLGILLFQALSYDIPFHIRYAAELMRTGALYSVLFSLLGIGLIPRASLGSTNLIVVLTVIGLLGSLFFSSVYTSFTGQELISGSNILVMQVTLSIVGLLLLEQVWRNTSIYSRAHIKFLVIGLLTMFGYDFVMYSDALLFQSLSSAFWDARGAINALAAPMIALTLMKRSANPLAMQVSRQMMFHTTTLILAGIYLLFLSAGGYYIQVFGGTWGEALRVFFVAGGCLLLIILISSPVIRARIMVFVSKNFFDYQYDYREEWIKSTNTLRHSFESQSLPVQSIRVLAQLVGSQQGCIWIRNEDGQYEPRGSLGLEKHRFDTVDEHADIVTFFSSRNWIIDLGEFMLDPTKYDLIEIPSAMLEPEAPWLIVPLKLNETLTGFVLLCNPVTQIELNWENYDLLKIVAQQASSYLEQADSQEKLGEARQFEAVSKTSAFLVHDIKTIIAQLSLLVRNAERHKHNPEFIDDMIRTTSHTVEKMDHLLNQIRNPQVDESFQQIELSQLLLSVYQDYKNSDPVPTLELPSNEIYVRADYSQFKSVIEHIVQNAIDASPKDGEVSIATKQAAQSVFIFIQDNGIGMSEAFIKHQLFKPFESTKGLTGMGIGAYQAREYLRRIGGSIDVTSEEGIGTCFTLKVPVIELSSKELSDTELIKN
jgi:putative PEP-CTERM system histidine kinase